MLKCPKCRSVLPAPTEREDGLPGIKYESCNNCGWSRAVTVRPRREKIAETKTTTKPNGRTER